MEETHESIEGVEMRARSQDTTSAPANPASASPSDTAAPPTTDTASSPTTSGPAPTAAKSPPPTTGTTPPSTGTTPPSMGTTPPATDSGPTRPTASPHNTPPPPASPTAPPASSSEPAAPTPANASTPYNPASIRQRFASVRDVRAYLNGTICTWFPPHLCAATNNTRPDTAGGEWAYVRGAVHSLTIGLGRNHADRNRDDDGLAIRIETRAWLLFDALNRLQDGGCVLQTQTDFSAVYPQEGDRALRYRARWVARFAGVAEAIVFEAREVDEVLLMYVAAPGAVMRVMERRRGGKVPAETALER
ncbi:hypothetical protein SLS58_005411 [Diplodia intermedia]|uniref:Uncharacterized protein n=1 Tax=Diplodia intermedia TaxID=856260 RepID=A0ABR3TR68_9PEZI